MSESTALQGFSITVTGITGRSISSDTRQNVKKRIADIRYLKNPTSDAVRLAYAGSKEISAKENLYIGDRSDRIYPNSKNEEGSEFIYTVSPIGIRHKNILVTQKFAVSNTTLPLYYKCVLSPEVDFNSIRIFDKDYLEVSDDHYLVEWVLEYDETTGMPVSPTNYTAIHVYNSLESSFDPVTGEYTVYYIQYLDGAGKLQTVLLNNELAYREATVEDIWSVTLDIAPWALAYIVEISSGNYFLRVPPVGGKYAVKYTSRSRVYVETPAVVDDTSAWYPRVANGSFSWRYGADPTFHGYTYEITEFPNQSFNPTEPYKKAMYVPCTMIANKLLSLPHKDIEAGGLYSPLSIVIENEGATIYALTTDTTIVGQRYKNMEGQDVLGEDGEYIVWSSDEILSLDCLSGIIQLSISLKDYWDIKAIYSYKEGYYEVSSVNMNPIFDSDISKQIRVLYMVPKSLPNANFSQVSAIQSLRVGASGLIEEISQDADTGNENLNFDAVVGDSDAHSIVGALGMHYNWRSSTYITEDCFLEPGSVLSVESTERFPWSGWIRTKDDNDDWTYSKFTRKTNSSITLSAEPEYVVTRGFLDLIEKQDVDGLHPSSLLAHPTGKFLYVALYADSTIKTYSIDQDTGELSLLDTTGGAGGFGFVMHPSGRFLYITDSIANTISYFSINTVTGIITLQGNVSLTSPWWLRIDPAGEYVYVTNFVELTPFPNYTYEQYITRYSINQSTGVLTFVDEILLPTGFSTGMCMDPLGRFIYVICNTMTGLVSYLIDPDTGALTEGEIFPDLSTGLQDIIINASGEFLLVADYTEKTISSYSINSDTGYLTIKDSEYIDCRPIALKIDPLRQFVYIVSWTNDDPNPPGSVTACYVNRTGSLILSKAADIGLGSLDLDIEPQGRYLYVANTEDHHVPGLDTLSIFSLHPPYVVTTGTKVEMVNFVDERTVQTSRIAAQELEEIGSSITLPVCYSQYLILAEMSINPNQSCKDIVLLDVREEGGGIPPEKYEEAKLKNPEVQWYYDYLRYNGQPTPGNAVDVIKIPASVLNRFTQEQVEAIVANNIPLGVLPIIRYYGYTPRITSLVVEGTTITIEWDKMGDEFSYSVWYATSKDGPWWRHNSIRIPEASSYVESNSYTLDDLAANTIYYVKVTCVDRYGHWWCSYDNYDSISGGYGNYDDAPIPPLGNNQSFSVTVN